MQDTVLPRALYDACLAQHSRLRAHPPVVHDAVPVPFRGDIAAYLASPTRVVTAALNPSAAEFRKDGPASFPTSPDNLSPAVLEQCLCAYFTHAPYRTWFANFEKLLNAMDTGYGGRMSTVQVRNTALHVDLCSPLATDPGWTRLPQAMRHRLTAEGHRIVTPLIAALQPDLVIASVAWRHIRSLAPPIADGPAWPTLLGYDATEQGAPLRNPLRLQARRIELFGATPVFANATASRTPLAGFNDARKRRLGAELARMVRFHASA